MSALLSFLGGSVFRMIFGEISSFFTKKQDHDQEMARMRLQAEVADKDHARMLENLRLQSELGVRQIEAQAVAEVDKSEALAFGYAMKDAFKPTGIWFVDVWNGLIRPAAATVVLFLWLLKLYHQDYRMAEWDMELAGVILGWFFANRTMGKNGK
jgi:hypothetical protein